MRLALSSIKQEQYRHFLCFWVTVEISLFTRLCPIMNKYFASALQGLAAWSIEALEVTQTASKQVKARILKKKLRVNSEAQRLKPLIRGLQAELQGEVETLEKKQDLAEAYSRKHALETELGAVQQSIASLCEPRRALLQEERRRLKEEEQERRLEAAALARRLRLEQEERETKRQEQLQALRGKVELEAVEKAAEVQRKEDLARAEKVQLLAALKVQAERRKGYLEKVKKLPKSLKSVSEPRGSTFPRITPVPGPAKQYYRSKLFGLLEREESRKREEAEQQRSFKLRRLEMQKHYAELVHEMFAPPIDLLKRKEIELMKQREECKVARVELRRRSSPSPAKRSQSTSVSATPLKAARKSRSSAPKPRPLKDFLKEMKHDLDARILKLPRLRGPLTPHRAERQALTRAELVKRLTPMSAVALKLMDEADDLLLASVKGKLAMLEY